MESFSTDIGSKLKPCTESFRFTAGGSEDVTKSLGNKPATLSRKQRAKARLSNKFNKVEGCNFGDKGHFGFGSSREWEHMRPRDVGQEEGVEPCDADYRSIAIPIDPSRVEPISRYLEHVCGVTGAKFAIKDSESHADTKVIVLEGSSDEFKQAFHMVFDFLSLIRRNLPLPC